MKSLLMVAVCLLAQDEPDAKQQWQRYYLQTASRYQVARQRDGEPQEELRIEAKPAMRWISINDFNGVVFVWSHNGRPELVGTLFSVGWDKPGQRRVIHEFASFSPATLNVKGPIGKAWRAPGLEQLPEVPGAPPPAKSARLRRLQCRQLARGFSAHMNRLGERWELRLLPKPLAEYENSSSRVLGGGLFAFVAYNTDPDILLLVEARQTASGPRWCFHPLRFSDKSLYLNYKEKLAWKSVRTRHGTTEPDTPDPQYHVFGGRTVTLEEDAGEKE
jgi:hypothetical protein